MPLPTLTSKKQSINMLTEWVACWNMGCLTACLPGAHGSKQRKTPAGRLQAERSCCPAPLHSPASLGLAVAGSPAQAPQTAAPAVWPRGPTSRSPHLRLCLKEHAADRWGRNLPSH